MRDLPTRNLLKKIEIFKLINLKIRIFLLKKIEIILIYQYEFINIMEDYLNRLQNNDTNLIELNLFNKNIGDNGAIAISETLKVNTTLQELNISSNNIGENGAIAISEALKVNTCLQILNISYNKIGENGEIAIKNALQYNYSLKEIYGVDVGDLFEYVFLFH